MSYILDALKKAESERKLGSVPDIYDATPQNQDRAAGKSRGWLAGLLALNAVMIVMAIIAWTAWINSRPAVPASAPVVPHPVTPLQPASNPPSPVADSRAYREVAPSPTSPGPVASVTMQSSAKPFASAESKMQNTAAASAASASAANEQIGSLRDLPDSIQREIPAATVNGYIYANNPVDRSALINNKLMHEGEQVEPGLVLDKLTPHGAVLSFKGYRYLLPY